MQESRLLVSDGTVPGGGQQTLSAFADRLLKECKMKVIIDVYAAEGSILCERLT